MKEIKITKRNGEFETWDEIATNGNTIRFKTARKEPYACYDMEMDADGFTGYRIGLFHETENGGTHFVTTEKITIKNPFFKIANCLFFDINKYMETYQEDVRTKPGE